MKYHFNELGSSKSNNETGIDNDFDWIRNNETREFSKSEEDDNSLSDSEEYDSVKEDDDLFESMRRKVSNDINKMISLFDDFDTVKDEEIHNSNELEKC